MTSFGKTYITRVTWTRLFLPLSKKYCVRFPWRLSPSMFVCFPIFARSILLSKLRTLKNTLAAYLGVKIQFPSDALEFVGQSDVWQHCRRSGYDNFTIRSWFSTRLKERATRTDFNLNAKAFRGNKYNLTIQWIQNRKTSSNQRLKIYG